MTDSHNSSMNNDSGLVGDHDDLASRFVDGLLTADEIPEPLRSSVLARAALFEQHRQSLLRIDATLSEIQIEAAVLAHRQQRSRRIPRSLGIAAAAASFLVLSGLVITQFGTNDASDVMTSDAESALAMSAADEFVLDGSDSGESDQSFSAKAGAATENSAADGGPSALYSDETSEPTGEIIDIESVSELEDLASSLRLEELAQESAQELSSPTCITDGSQRLITRRARFRGTLVEIYQVPSGESSGRLNVFAQSDCSLVAGLGP